MAVRFPEKKPRWSSRDTLLRVLGWPALMLQQDPATWDRWRWVRAQLRGGTLRTLDAGSGSGAFTMYAARFGNTTIGLSLDEAANETARRRAALLELRRVRFATADLRRLDELSDDLGSFDQILCLETIEHVGNDAKLVKDLAHLLRPGGRLLLTTPYDRHRPLVDEALSTVEDGGHVRWGYSAERLEALFNRAGLKVESRAYLSGVICQQITNLARLLARAVGVRAAWVLTAPLRLLLVTDRPLTRFLGYPWLAIAAVGVKP